MAEVEQATEATGIKILKSLIFKNTLFKLLKHREADHVIRAWWLGESGSERGRVRHHFQTKTVLVSKLKLRTSHATTATGISVEVAREAAIFLDLWG